MKKKNLPRPIKQHLFLLHNGILNHLETLKELCERDLKLLFGEKIEVEGYKIYPSLSAFQDSDLGIKVSGNPSAGSSLTEEDVHSLYYALGFDIETVAINLRKNIEEYNCLVRTIHAVENKLK